MAPLAESILVTLAEVAIGIGGFSGIVIALLRDRGPPPAELRVLVSILLLTSISVIGLAFLPLLLAVTGVLDDYQWRICSAFSVVWVLSMLFLRQRQLGEVSMGRRFPLLLPGIGLNMLGLVFNILNVMWLNDDWPYLVGLVGYMFFSFSVFVTLLWEVWTAKEESEEPAGE